MRRAFAISVLLAATGAAMALGAFRAGSYSGTIGGAGSIAFKATSAAVTSFKAVLPAKCGNVRVTSARLPLSRAGHFGGAAFPVSGTLSGSRATGTIKGGRCKAALKWSARRDAAAKGGLTCTPVGTFNGTDLQIDMSCGGADFDGFDVQIPRPATRADTSTAHLACFAGNESGPSYTGPSVNCSGQNTKIKSGRVIIRFSDPATCADASKTKVAALVVGDASYGPFALKTASC